MKIIKFYIVLFLLFSGNIFLIAQNRLLGTDWQLEVNERGQISSYISEGEEILFRNDEYAGPAFEGVELKKVTHMNFVGLKDEIEYSISYQKDQDRLAIEAIITNTSDSYFQPEYSRLFLGLNTEMIEYPTWDQKFFPTMVRAERTHFTGYAMSPLGRILAFASPDPLPSWNYHYVPSDWYTPSDSILENSKAERNGHRIYTISFDMLHKLPLPARHPQHLIGLKPGEKVKLKFYLKELESLDDLQEFFGEVTHAPAIELDNYTVATSQEFRGTVYATEQPSIQIFAPDNQVQAVLSEKVSENLYAFSFKPDRGVGYYEVLVKNGSGKVSEALGYCRNSWSWYLDQARTEAMKNKPWVTHHAESFLYLYSTLLAQKHLPDPQIDTLAEELFYRQVAAVFDSISLEMINGKYRLQDAAMMVGIFADRFEITREEKYLKYASGLVDFLITSQMEDGGYYYLKEPRKHYTSVIYLAKSIMEYLTVIEPLTKDNSYWEEKYKYQSMSVRRALDNLAILEDNIQTEGMMTFEDGMISCSATQLALGALRTTDEIRRNKYANVAQKLTAKHQSLTLLKIPDARMNGATLRFWESQYTVNFIHGMMNSPSGWSAWKTYGMWYQYLLTGNKQYLDYVFNSLGMFMQLIDSETGELRFCFSVDPYIESAQFLESPKGSGIPKLREVVVGEQYISMMSPWHGEKYPTWREKWGIDNFVHEIFKCLEEVALTNAYLIETETGFDCFNCDVVKDGDELIVTPTENLIDRLHVNLKNEYHVSFQKLVPVQIKNVKGMCWMGGIPALVDKHTFDDRTDKPK